MITSRALLAHVAMALPIFGRRATHIGFEEADKVAVIVKLHVERDLLDRFDRG